MTFQVHQLIKCTGGVDGCKVPVVV